MKIALQYYELKDLIGKFIYKTNGEKVGEVEKAVFLKDGKGALILRHTDQIILVETVQSIADVIIVGQTEAKTQVPAEEMRPKTPETSLELTPPIQIEQSASQADHFTNHVSTSPFEKLGRAALVETLKELLHEHSVRSARNTALNSLMERDPYKGLLELLSFIEESLIPHEKKEEEQVFPILAQRQPSKEPLITELSSEHKYILDTFMLIRRAQGNGRIPESRRLSQQILSQLNNHYAKEDPLFQSLLKELSST